MKDQKKRYYSKKNYLHNGTKSPVQISKNNFVTTVQEPGINESGMEAKKNGW